MRAVHRTACPDARAPSVGERKEPKRDPSTGKLVGDPLRFPHGMKALGR
jgi:hypothetical protein